MEGNRTEWSYGRFGRFQGYSGSFSYTLNNDSWKKWFGPKDEKDSKGDKDKKNEIWMSTVMMAMKTRRKKITPV